MNVVRTQSNRQMFISQTLRLWKSLKNKAWLTKIQNLLQLTPMHALVLPWSRRVRERRRSRSQIIVRPLRIAVSCKKWRVLTSLMVAQVAKYCEIPQPAHWNAIIKRILLLAYTYFVPKRNLWLRILVRRKIWRRYWLYWCWWRLGWLQVNVNKIFFYKSGLITRMYRTIIYFGVSVLGDRVLPVYSTLKNRNKYIQLWGCGVKRQETREFIPENLVSVVNRHFFKATWWIIQTKPVIYSSQVLLLVQSSKTVLNRILLK